MAMRHEPVAAERACVAASEEEAATRAKVDRLLSELARKLEEHVENEMQDGRSTTSADEHQEDRMRGSQSTISEEDRLEDELSEGRSVVTAEEHLEHEVRGNRSTVSAEEHLEDELQEGRSVITAQELESHVPQDGRIVVFGNVKAWVELRELERKRDELLHVHLELIREKDKKSRTVQSLEGDVSTLGLDDPFVLVMVESDECVRLRSQRCSLRSKRAFNPAFLCQKDLLIWPCYQRKSMGRCYLRMVRNHSNGGLDEKQTSVLQWRRSFTLRLTSIIDY